MRLSLLVVLVLLGSVRFSYAQSLPDDYVIARQYLKKDQSLKAQHMFEQLQTDKKTPEFLQPFIQYYKAVCQYRRFELGQAESSLILLQDRHPKWIHLPDAYYLRAIIKYKQDDFIQAEKLLKKIDKTPPFDTLAYNLRSHFYNNATPLQLAKTWKETVGSKALAAEILYRSATTDSPEIRSIIAQVEKSKFAKSLRKVNETPKLQKSYKIGVLLPFDLNKNGDYPTTPAYDFYVGLKLAVDSLKNRNNGAPKIEIFCYDTQNNPTRITEILRKKELKGMDMLVGPMYRNGCDVVYDFAYQNRIPTVNPLSKQFISAQQNKYVLFTEPSFSNEANAYYNRTTNHPDGAVILFVGPHPNDEKVAQKIKTAFDSAGVTYFYEEYTISSETHWGKYFKKPPPREVKGRNGQVIKEKSIKEIEAVSNPKNIQAIFGISNSAKGSHPLISRLAIAQISINLYTPVNWLTDSHIPFENWVKQKTVFLGYPPHTTDTIAQQNFYRNFLNKRHIIPSEFSKKGFDTGLFFMGCLQKLGNNLLTDIDKEPTFKGLNYWIKYEKDNNANVAIPAHKPIFDEETKGLILLPVPTAQD